MVISVGYRVKSQRGIQFRLWASKIIKEYMKKGFVLDDNRLKELGGGGYFKELLERIRDIRASEKVFYRQVLEIYATSIDYDPKSDISIDFLKKYKTRYIMRFTVKQRLKQFIIERTPKKSLWDLLHLSEIIRL